MREKASNISNEVKPAKHMQNIVTLNVETFCGEKEGGHTKRILIFESFFIKNNYWRVKKHIHCIILVEECKYEHESYQDRVPRQDKELFEIKKSKYADAILLLIHQCLRPNSVLRIEYFAKMQVLRIRIKYSTRKCLDESGRPVQNGLK